MKDMKLIERGLETILSNIKTGNSSLTDSEYDELLDTIVRTINTKTKYSKYQAYHYLKISRATFDNWVKNGKLPEGRKEPGFKEKFWYLSDLKPVKDELKNKINSDF